MLFQITPTKFLESVNSLNEILIDAHSLRYALFDNCLEIFSLQLSRLVLSTHYDRVRPFLTFYIDSLSIDSTCSKCVGCNGVWMH